MKMLRFLSLLLPALSALSCAQGTPAPYGALPTPAQVAWQRMEMNMFVHFGPNTFSGKEWGDGTEPEDMFHPTALDCRQWARTARDAGFRGIILTAKHHDGFCLWPNPESAHTVAQSRWRDGRGDVLRELSDACREYGLKFGIYISPWDRNDPRYGSPAYNDAFVKTLESVLDGRYGPVYEQWFDGACGEGPTGRRQVYDWPLFNGTVARLQPDAVIFSDAGPGCRWVGNERGVAGETSWSTLNIEGFSAGAGAPPIDTLTRGNVGGAAWVPAETDVSIRPGWFWRASENDRVKSLQHLLKIYYESVGRNSLLLLNVPPDTCGRIFAADSLRLMELRAALDTIFAEDLAAGARVQAAARRGRAFRPALLLDGDPDTYWAAREGDPAPEVTLSFPSPVTFNRIVLQEYIPLGQRIASFRVEAQDEAGAWIPLVSGTTVGCKRILLTPRTTARALRLRIDASLAPPLLSGLSLYDDRIYAE